MYVRYRSNNSGGGWWLDDEDWFALEKAGWIVDWARDSKGYGRLEGDRWLGALAVMAQREGLSLRDAVEEWEQVTGKSSTEAGCPCCGNPHSFTEYDDNDNWVASGPTINYSAEW